MALGDIYEASLLYSIKGEKVANVLHFREDVTPGTVDPPLDLANTISASFWTGNLDLVMSNDVTLQMIRARRISPTLGGGILLPVNTDGQVSADTLPPNNCAVMTLYTARTDRAGRGRVFLSGVPDTWQGDGLIEVAVAPTYQAIMDNLKTYFTSADGGQWQCGIWSPTYSDFNVITRVQVRSWVHVLRGRRMVAP